MNAWIHPALYKMYKNKIKKAPRSFHLNYFKEICIVNRNQTGVWTKSNKLVLMFKKNQRSINLYDIPSVFFQYEDFLQTTKITSSL